MIDFLRRVFRHPLDYFGIVTLHKLILLRVEQKSEKIFSFVFSIPEGLTWKAGQHGVFWFIGGGIKGNNWRAFSIASTPEENELRIATIISDTPSDFKRKLKTLVPGDSIEMQGPFGEFHLHDDMKEVIGIAGGIGITPFRALLKSVVRGDKPAIHITLIYSAAQGLYTFKKELDQYAESSQIDIVYTETPEEVNQALDEQVVACGKDAAFFISGSPGMVNALRKSCFDKGAVRVISDPFNGY
jgi:ferredoxin-NADP reductase